jgi:hypothetical protein
MARVAALITALAAHPRRLFLLDGGGALITASAVGLVLPALPEAVGMPTSVLRSLALAACVLAVWSFSCAAFAPRLWPWLLRGVACANTAYCAVTAACLWRFRPQLLPLDWLYFPGEIVLILALVALEWQVAARAVPNRLNSALP